MRASVASALVLLLVSLVVPAPAAAQLERGQIAGFVKDQSGAVIPGATVTAINTQTRLTRSVVSDSTGYYVFPSLAPGTYDVQVELEGFKKGLQVGVRLDASARIAVDITLETGAITEALTVTAEATPLQTDASIRKTVEAKDIELLSFQGRNPLGVAGLKAGVVGGSFNNLGFAAFSNGGYSINGSRPDENTIYNDGAIAIRTRSSGTIIGIPDVEAVQEVQLLTANYMPEFGRASGGQIRFVTKSGSNRYSGSGSFFYPRRVTAGQHVVAQPQHEPGGELRARPLRVQAVRLLGRRPRAGRDLQGQVLLLRRSGVGGLLPGADEHGDRADRERCAAATSASCSNPSNGFFTGARVHHRSAGRTRRFRTTSSRRSCCRRTGWRCSTRIRCLPRASARARRTSVRRSENPQDQRKDTIRLDYRVNDSHQLTYRYSSQNWVAVDAFRGQFPFARTDWDRPNSTQIINWTSTWGTNLVNETELHALARRGVHQRLHRDRGCISAAARASTSRTSSRARRSTTRFRRSRSAAAGSTRSTAARTRRRRRGRSTPCRT